MEKHDIWIQINPKPTHDRSLLMNQMKIFGNWQSAFVTDSNIIDLLVNLNANANSKIDD